MTRSNRSIYKLHENRSKCSLKGKSHFVDIFENMWAGAFVLEIDNNGIQFSVDLYLNVFVLTDKRKKNTYRIPTKIIKTRDCNSISMKWMSINKCEIETFLLIKLFFSFVCSPVPYFHFVDEHAERVVVVGCWYSVQDA